MRRRTFIGASVGSVTAGAAAWPSMATPTPAADASARGGRLPSGHRLHTGVDTAFGTTIRVDVLHNDPRQAELAIEDALHEAKKIDALLSIHSESSQVFRLNRQGQLAHPDPHLLVVLEQARQLSALTNGAFDITVQPLWLAFNQAAAANALPSSEARRQAQSLVDWTQLQWGPDQVRFQKPGMAITLNGIAQGYAVDLALAAVQARGVEHALLDTGEFISRGSNPSSRPWVLGIQDPRQADACTAALQMDGRSVATSGDYETAFTPDFVHHHILDPATADSPLELASVTVLAPTGLLADGLSTALFVLGPEKALALASRLSQVDVLMLGKAGQVWKTARFPALPA